MPKVSQIIYSAVLKIGAVAQGETIPPEELSANLDELNRLIDLWDAKRQLIYAVNFAEYTLIPNKAPMTIGPTGDFKVSIRPARLVSANFVLTGSTNDTDYPLHIMNDQEWADIRIKGLTSNISRSVYYSPDVPNGNLFFWPVPTSAYSVRLETWTNLGQAAGINDTLVLPTGYWNAMVATLAVKLSPSYQRPVSPELANEQREAVRAIGGNNSKAPLLRTNEGMDHPRP